MFLIERKGVAAVAAFAKAVYEIANHSLDQLAHRGVVFND
jgi:hypothetical protein